MKIFVIGGVGFIGFVVVWLVVCCGYEVVSFDVLIYVVNLENVVLVLNSLFYVFEQVDLCDCVVLDWVLVMYKFDVIMYLVVESYVDRFIDGLGDFIEMNIIGIYNLLEVVCVYWIVEGCFEGFCFYYILIDEVFGLFGEIGQFIEDIFYDFCSFYFVLKVVLDYLVCVWYEIYGLLVVLINCFNNYGLFYFFEKLVLVVILNVLYGCFILVYGDGGNVCDWLYVEDYVDVLLLVLEKGELGCSYNIGGENEVKNIDLVCMICVYMDRLCFENVLYDKLIIFVIDWFGYDRCYVIDLICICEELGWCFLVMVEEGLVCIVEWYLDNQDWWQLLLVWQGVGQWLGMV